MKFFSEKYGCSGKRLDSGNEVVARHINIPQSNSYTNVVGLQDIKLSKVQNSKTHFPNAEHTFFLTFFGFSFFCSPSSS
jgi:hypothetical protein